MNITINKTVLILAFVAHFICSVGMVQANEDEGSASVKMNLNLDSEASSKDKLDDLMALIAVSYTHLTLPTILLV